MSLDLARIVKRTKTKPENGPAGPEVGRLREGDCLHLGACPATCWLVSVLGRTHIATPGPWLWSLRAAGTQLRPAARPCGVCGRSSWPSSLCPVPPCPSHSHPAAFLPRSGHVVCLLGHKGPPLCARQVDDQRTGCSSLPTVAAPAWGWAPSGFLFFVSSGS